MGRRIIRRLLIAYALAMLLGVCVFVARFFFGFEAKELHNSTPAIANRFTYGDIRVPKDADSVYLDRRYYPPRISMRFHADKARIEQWVASRLKTKRFREVPIPRDPDTGLSWFNPAGIRHGRAFVEDGVDDGEEIFVDCDRSVVFFSN